VFSRSFRSRAILSNCFMRINRCVTLNALKTRHERPTRGELGSARELAAPLSRQFVPEKGGCGAEEGVTGLCRNLNAQWRQAERMGTRIEECQTLRG
jgi:hypothetical protein